MLTAAAHPAPTAPLSSLAGRTPTATSQPCCRCDALSMAEALPATLPRLRSLGGLKARDPRTGGQLRDLACDECRTVWFITFDRTDTIVEWQLAGTQS